MLQWRITRWSVRYALLLLTLPLLFGSTSLLAHPAVTQRDSYTNPLPVTIPGGGTVESCADPSMLHAGTSWYIYCTSDPLNGNDRNAQGGFNFRVIPTLQSSDLVSWTYVGDAFDLAAPDAGRPSWAEPTSGIWAPEVDYIDGRYVMYFVATDVKPDVSGEPQGCHDDNAIGMATSLSPTGPWTYEPAPLVPPRRNGPGCNFFWSFDPEVITARDGSRYIYYGSYYGGIVAQPLAANGLATTGPVTQITIPNRYEGAEVVYRAGFYYLFASATNCCNGPLTAYSVFVGRSHDPLGPFVDREGVSLLEGRVGGTPFMMQNGNRWVGAGHNSVFVDAKGQWWTVYHAVDRLTHTSRGRPGSPSARRSWTRSTGTAAGRC
jgi:arabinan endo-1,5-alpha-L-arabinosidase